VTPVSIRKIGDPPYITTCIAHFPSYLKYEHIVVVDPHSVSNEDWTLAAQLNGPGVTLAAQRNAPGVISTEGPP
jgi:hypothetical protein